MLSTESAAKKRIAVVSLNNILKTPPVMHLVDNLLSNGHEVYLVSSNTREISSAILENPRLHCFDIPMKKGRGLPIRTLNRFIRTTKGKSAVKQAMNKADILWTATDETVRSLGRLVYKYKQVMQLLELEQWYPIATCVPFIKFPIDEYARHAWKVVVPEINRAYIQKAWWSLQKVPYVLPNKPYRLETGEPTVDMKAPLQRIANEKRKVVLFLGMVGRDRNLDVFAKAIEKLDDEYCLYIIGDPIDSYREEFKRLLEKRCSIRHLGFFPAPKHLLFVKYAYIGILPYIPKTNMAFRSQLNALYCAPNKIYEYAGFGVPMLGTDVLGLRQPFEQYNIGVCCKEISVDAVIASIRAIEMKHDVMSANCKRFYDSANLDELVESVLYEEP